MLMKSFLKVALFEFRRLKALGEGALRQVPEGSLHVSPCEGENSIAVLARHLAGNMRSRWTNFLTTDGEKPDRRRDTEFESRTGEGREEILRIWEEGWSSVFAALDPLEEEDLGRSILIRGEPHTVLQAICRQLTHYAYHVGQIVSLARRLAGSDWTWLSVPPGGSEAFNRDPKKYRGG